MAECVTLPNGFRVIVETDRSAPVAAASFWARAGLCDEPSNRRGIAHFLEHMMFRGSRHFGNKEHFRRIEALGGSCNAFTDSDETVYHETVPAAGLEQVFELEADRFQRILLRQEDADVERKVILEELRAYENQPMTRALFQVVRRVGGEHPYALTPLGLHADVSATSADDLRAFHARLYRPENVFGVVVGDVTPEEVERLAVRYFGAWQAAAGAPAAPGPAYLPATGAQALRLSVEVPIAARLHRLRPPAEEDLPALELLESMLGGGAASPLREEIVRKRRLGVEAAHMAIKNRRGGLLAFFTVFLPPGRHAARREAMREVCERMVEHGPAPERFEEHLKRFRKTRYFECYEFETRMLKLGSAESLEGDYRAYERALRDLEAVTPERVRGLAERLFAPANTLELDIVPENLKWWMYPLGLALKLWPLK